MNTQGLCSTVAQKTAVPVSGLNVIRTPWLLPVWTTTPLCSMQPARLVGPGNGVDRRESNADVWNLHDALQIQYWSLFQRNQSLEHDVMQWSEQYCETVTCSAILLYIIMQQLQYIKEPKFS